MSDRLDELRRQRALVQQHLNWLDREIASLTLTRLAQPPSATVAHSPPPVPAASPSLPRPPVDAAPAPDLAEFQVNPADVQGDTRRGCLIYSAIALLGLALILGVIFFVGYRDHPLLVVPDATGAPSHPTHPAGPSRPAPPTPGEPGQPAK